MSKREWTERRPGGRILVLGVLATLIGAVGATSPAAAGSENPRAVPSGGAFGERVAVRTLLDTEVTSGPTPAVTLPKSGGGPFTSSVASILVPDLLSVGLAEVSTEGARGGGAFAESSADVATAAVPGVLSADAVHSECRSEPSGSQGSSQFVNLSVLGEPVAVEVEPNTKIDLAGIGTLILNQQRTRDTPQETRIEVTAIHLILDGGALGTGDIKVAQSECALLPSGGALAVSGSAFGEKVDVRTLEGIQVSSGPMPQVVLPPGGGGPLTANLAGVAVGSLLTTGLLEVSTEGAVAPSQFSESSADVSEASVPGVLAAQAVHSECRTDTSGSTASTRLVGLVTGGILPPVTVEPPPNTTIDLLGIGQLILNEQKVIDGPKVKAVTVNAVHLKLNGGPLGTGDIILAQSHCDVKLPA